MHNLSTTFTAKRILYFVLFFYYFSVKDIFHERAWLVSSVFSVQVRKLRHSQAPFSFCPLERENEDRDYHITRLNAAAFFYFLAIMMRHLFKGGVYFKIVFLKSHVCKFM